MKGSKLQGKEGPLIKLRNTTSNSELANISSKHSGGGISEGYESVSPKNVPSVLGKRSAEDSASARRTEHFSMGHEDDASVSGDPIDDGSSLASVSQASTKERKPFLKFKIPKNSSNGNQNTSSDSNIGNPDSLPPGKNEIIYTRGQRSKRRRPAVGDEESSQKFEDSTIKDFTDANWILQKLGKDAAGKRVEVHQPSSNSW